YTIWCIRVFINSTGLVRLTVAGFCRTAETRFRNVLFTCNPFNGFTPQHGAVHEWMFMTLTNHQTVVFNIFMQYKPGTFFCTLHTANTDPAALTERIVH